jgi:hypothetical protein
MTCPVGFVDGIDDALKRADHRSLNYSGIAAFVIILVDEVQNPTAIKAATKAFMN